MLEAEEEPLYHEPFLQSKEGEQENDVIERHWRDSMRSGSPGWTLRTNLFIHFALILFYTIITVILLRKNLPPTIYSNASIHDLTIAYKQNLFVNLTNNPFAGQPSPDIDDAWDNLMGNMNIRVTAEELQRNHQYSVALPEGGGHLAWLGVFHELHCINMIRKWVYRDYYHPNISNHESAHWASHADHCIDLLRQTALCHTDTSLTTFVWNATAAKPMFDSSRSLHRCVDFDAVVASTRRRVVGLGELGRLRNPLG